MRPTALSELGYSYTAVVLKQAGVDPKDVNFVVQADADPVKLYLDGKNDAVFVATTWAAALKVNPANKAHVIHSQVMDEPWAHLDCCILVMMVWPSPVEISAQTASLLVPNALSWWPHFSRGFRPDPGLGRG